MNRWVIVGATGLGSAVVIGTVIFVATSFHDVHATGSRGIRGHLYDGNGSPLNFVRVASEEHADLTEEDGAFEVHWKPPSTFVDLRVGGVTWRRVWQPDDPSIVELRLPRTEEALVSCKTDRQQECLAELIWEYPDGLSARLDLDCGETASLKVPQLPVDPPTRVRCPTIVGDQPMVVTRDRGTLLVESEPSPVPVSFEEGTPNRGRDCDIELVDGEVVLFGRVRRLAPDGPTHVWSLCDGLPGTPVAVSPRKRGLRDVDVAVTLPVTDAPNRLALPESIPEPRTLHLVRRVDAKGGVVWRQHLEPLEDGSYALPSLPPGHYAVWLGSAELFSTHPLPAPELPGEVWIRRFGDADTWGEGGGLLGAFFVEEETEGVELEVQVTEAREDQ